jgi:hypothetical protein
MELTYPLVSRVEGVGPMQYGSKGLLGKQFADIEEKYDLSEATDGFGEEGEDDANGADDGEDQDDDSDEDSNEDSDSGNGGFLDDSFEAY